MTFLLDTNICIFLLKRSKPSLAARVLTHRAAELALSSITLAELTFGVENSARVDANRDSLSAFQSEIQVLPFDASAAEAYGPTRAVLQRAGTPIGSNDLLIAAHALALGATLVTNNRREFSRVPRLRIEDWST